MTNFRAAAVSGASKTEHSQRPRKKRWAWVLLAVTVVALILARGCSALLIPADNSSKLFPGVPHAGSLPDGEYQMRLESALFPGGKFAKGCTHFAGLVYSRTGKEELGKYRFGCADGLGPYQSVDKEADSLFLRVEDGEVIITDVVRQRGKSVNVLPDGNYNMKEIKGFFRFQVDDKCSHSGIVYDGAKNNLGLHWILGESYAECPTRTVSEIYFDVENGEAKVERVITVSTWDDASALPDGDYLLTKIDLTAYSKERTTCTYNGSVVDERTNTDLGLYFIFDLSLDGLATEDCSRFSGSIRFTVKNGEVLITAALPPVRPNYLPKPQPAATP